MGKLFELLSWLSWGVAILIPDSMIREGIQPILAHIGLLVTATFLMVCSIKYGRKS